jgi:hypothetical protein
MQNCYHDKDFRSKRQGNSYSLQNFPFALVSRAVFYNDANTESGERER